MTAALDKFIAILEAAFDGQPPQQTALRVHFTVTRADLAELRALLARQEEGR